MSKAQVYFIIPLLFALIVAVFALQNTEQISINFLFWQFKAISKVIVILSSALFGSLLVMFLGMGWQVKKLLYIRKLENEIKELKNTISAQSAGQSQQLAETTAAEAASTNIIM